MIERGTIEQINARGRVTLRLADRVVVADLHSGSGGSIGDVVEGDMRPGLQSWRNVGNSIVSVVEVVAIQGVGMDDGMTAPRRDAQRVRRADVASGNGSSVDQNTRRKFS